MILIKNVESLNFESALLEKKKNVLRELFNKGKISQVTFDFIDKRISKIESLIAALKDVLQENAEFWGSIVSEEIRILESILVDFKFLNLIGEIDVDEWINTSEIISLGIESLSKKSFSEPTKNVSKAENKEGSVAIDFENASLSSSERVDVSNRKKKVKTNNTRNSRRKLTRIEAVKSSDSHCMNPWTPECRGTNIKLSIYYNGQFLPICEECWKEISKKNIEWST